MTSLGSMPKTNQSEISEIPLGSVVREFIPVCLSYRVDVENVIRYVHITCY